MIWQPIETAPKRGERLILWVPKTNCGTCIGKWDSRYVTHDHKVEGWWLEGFSLPFHKEPYLPTLWQHLPEAPKGGDAT